LFRADDGSPLSLPLVVTQRGARQTGTSSEVGRTIQPLATLVIESEAPANSRMAAQNPTWGEERIANEWKLKLGIRVRENARGTCVSRVRKWVGSWVG